MLNNYWCVKLKQKPNVNSFNGWWKVLILWCWRSPQLCCGVCVCVEGWDGGPSGWCRFGAAAAGSALHYRPLRVRENLRPARPTFRPISSVLPRAPPIKLQHHWRCRAGRWALDMPMLHFIHLLAVILNYEYRKSSEETCYCCVFRSFNVVGVHYRSRYRGQGFLRQHRWAGRHGRRTCVPVRIYWYVSSYVFIVTYTCSVVVISFSF